ncbi:hypothetical protein [Luteolibacter sp. Populi]
MKLKEWQGFSTKLCSRDQFEALEVSFWAIPGDIDENWVYMANNSM